MGLFSFRRKKKTLSEKEKYSNSPDDFVETTNEIDLSNRSVNIDINNRSAEINAAYSKKLDSNLLPGEILLMNWCDGRSAEETAPNYFAYTYGINWNNSLRSLIKKKLLRTAKPSELLPRLTVQKLKEILSENNIKTTGKKKDLIERIADEIPEKKYETKLPKGYKTTPEGESLLQKYEKIIWAHKNGSQDGVVDVASFLPFISDRRSPEEIALSISSNNFKQNIKNMQYGFAYGSLLYQASIMEKNKQYEQALTLYLTITVFEFTGIGNVIIGIGDYYINKDINLDYIKAKIIECQGKLKLSSQNILQQGKVLISKYYGPLPTVKLYNSEKEYFQLLNVLINGTREDFTAMIDKMYKRVPERYKLF